MSPAMGLSSLAFLVPLLVVAHAGGLNRTSGCSASWIEGIPRCSTQCALSKERLFNYLLEATYTYKYSGKSQVHLKDVEGGSSESEWSSLVDITWLSYCDVAITFRNVTVDSKMGIAEATTLEKHPLIMALDDGRVQHVCAHPDDEAWSVNWKKGIAGTFQIALPVRSDINSELEFAETDTVGKCPTKYQVRKDGNAIWMKKEKDHRRCRERYPTNFETPAAWMKAPLPLDESKTECNTKFFNGMFETIICEDKSVIRPAYGVYKYAETNQQSTFHFEKMSCNAPQALIDLKGPLIHKSLLYDYSAPKKDESLVPQLDETLKELCEKTKLSIEAEAAQIMAKTLRLLRLIPRTDIEATLTKITSGQICSDHKRLEALYLDAIAFVQEPGAVDIMVKELVSGRATEGRAVLYTAAFHLIAKPNIQAIQALIPLFEAPHVIVSAKLAASSMVYSYCQHNPQCYESSPVKQIVDFIVRKVQQNCIPSGSEERTNEALASIKILGNIGVMNLEEAMSVIKCLKTEEAQESIRIAAAQAFRNADCQTMVTKELVAIVTDSAVSTEVRIASYLASLQCVQAEDIQNIISHITREDNTQVRGFVLSHLLNLQESSSPRKERLRYLLTGDVLPVNFTADFRKYSRNIDISYYIESLGLGAEYESDVIFSPGSYVPRSGNFNFTTLIGGIPINLGEFGVRVEGLEPIIRQLFGPGGYLQKSSFLKIFGDLGSTFQEGAKFLTALKQGKPLDAFGTASAFSDFLKMLPREDREKQKAEAYVRFRGQEMTYGAWSGDFRDFDIKDLFESLLNTFDEFVDQLSDMKIDTARTAQMKLDYSLPTSQGIPVKLELEGTGVFGFKMGSKLEGSGSTESGNLVEVLPGFALQVDGFVGFDSHLSKTGIRIDNSVSSNSGVTITVDTKDEHDLEFKINLPDSMELLNVRSEVFLMKKTIGLPETKIIPPSVRNVRIQNSSCISQLDSLLGLQLCYDYNIPNVFHSQGLPLGDPTTFKLFLQKSDASLTGYSLKSSFQDDESGTKVLKIMMAFTGSTPSRSAETTLMYKRGENNYILYANVETPGFEGNVWMNLIHQNEYKALETFAKWNSNGIRATRGFKVDLKTHWTQQEKEIEVNIYTSNSHQFSPDSRIMEMKFQEITTGRQMSVNFHAKTMRDLRKFAAVNIEVSGDLLYSRDLKIYIPHKLTKCEIQFIIGDLVATAHIRKEAEGQYKSVFIVTAGRKELLGLVAKHLIEKSEQDLTIKTSAEGHVREASYKWDFDISLGRKMGLALTIIRKSHDKRILSFEGFYLNTEKEVGARFMLDIPEYMDILKVQGMITKQGKGNYVFEAALNQGRQTVLHMSGPIAVSIEVSATSKIQADVKISTLIGGPFTISTSAEWSSKKHDLKLIIKDKGEVFLSYGWLFQVDVTQQWTIKMDILFPLLTNFNLEIFIKEKMLHINTNTLLLPKSSAPKRYKGLVDVDFDRKELKTNVAWDADRDPSKKMSADIKLISAPSHQSQIILSGRVNYREESYELLLGLSGSEKVLWRRGIKIKLIAPDGKAMEFHTDLSVGSQVLHHLQLNFLITFEDFGGHLYHFSESLRLTKFHPNGEIEAVFQSNFQSPATPRTSLHMDCFYVYNEERGRIFSLTTKIESPLLRSPLETYFDINNAYEAYKITFKSNLDTSIDIFMWEVVLHPHIKIDKIVLYLDMSNVVKILETMHKLVTSHDAHSEMEGISALHHKYHISYNRSSPHNHLILIKSPSRTIEGEVKHSPHEYLLRIYPDKERTASKYEISTEIRSEESSLAHIAKWSSRISHPSLTRDITVSLQYTSEGSNSLGSIEIDVFSDEADKLNGTLYSTYLTPYSIYGFGTLSSRALKRDPLFSMTSAYTKGIMSFSMDYQRSVAEEPLFKMSGRIDQSRDKEIAVGFNLFTLNQSIAAFSGSIFPEEGPCYGYNMQANVRAINFGQYNLNSKVCNPSFLEVGVNKHGKLDVFKVRMGYHDPMRAEISLSAEAKDTLQEAPLLMARAALGSDTMINIDLAKATDKISWMKSLVADEWDRIQTILMKITHSLRAAVHLESTEYPSSNFFRLIRKFKSEVKDIYSDLYRDVRQDPLVHKLKPWFMNTVSYLHKIQKSIGSLRDKINMAFQEDFQGLIDSAIDVAVRILRMIEDGEVPGMVKWIIGVINQIPEVQDFKKYVESLIEKYPDDVEALKAIVAKVISRLEEDIDDIRENFGSTPEMQKEFNWLMQNYNRILGLQLDKIISRILHDLLLISVQNEDHFLRISIPTYRPVNSLLQVLELMLPESTTTLKGIVWYLYSFQPRSIQKLIWQSHAFRGGLLPPYNRTAVVVDGTELLTFDGTALRTPSSSCKVLLVAFESTSLVMEHIHPSKDPQLTLRTSHTKVVIMPNHRLFINGKEMRGPEVSEGEIHIIRTPEKIIVKTPSLTLYLVNENRVVSVEVSGWVFDQTKGLLGSYDGEIANDWMMPNGEMAHSLQELVRSWQDDQSCPTPSISPVDPRTVEGWKVFKCHALLSERSFCSAVINPEPFIRMCYGTRSACAAQSAYHTMCATKGFHAPFLTPCPR